MISDAEKRTCDDDGVVCLRRAFDRRLLDSTVETCNFMPTLWRRKNREAIA